MKFDLAIDPPVLNAAGTLGFAPGGLTRNAFGGLGAFVTNPFTRHGRTPAHNRDLITFPGGFLMHTGYPNPGVRRVLQHYAPAWERSPVPVIVHLLAETESDVAEMVRMVEATEGVAAIELGLPLEAGVELAARLVAAAASELPVIARLPLDRAQELAQASRAAGAAVLSLGPARGALPGAGGQLVHGRLYGPGLFPQALEAVNAIAGAGLPVIGAGGVCRREQVDVLLAAGAVAVQIDSALWQMFET